MTAHMSISTARPLPESAGWVWDVTIGSDRYKVAWTMADRRLRLSWPTPGGDWHQWVTLDARYGAPGDLLDATAAVHAWADAKAARGAALECGQTGGKVTYRRLGLEEWRP